MTMRALMACALPFVIFSYMSATAQTSSDSFELLADCVVN